MGNLMWAVRELNSEGRVGVKKRKREGKEESIPEMKPRLLLVRNKSTS